MYELHIRELGGVAVLFFSNGEVGTLAFGFEDTIQGAVHCTFSIHLSCIYTNTIKTNHPEIHAGIHDRQSGVHAI